MERIGIVGAGTMGRGIAYVAITHGAQVVLYDVVSKALANARAQIEDALWEAAAKGRIAEGEAQNALERLQLGRALEDLADAEVIIEAAPEDLALKQEIFRQLDALCPPSTILASNTSSLSITALGAATRRPERVAGMHFFNPAPVMRLVEVVRGLRTAEETVRALADLARRWGKTPVIVKDTPGFIVNRVARPFYLEALRLVGEGVADPPTVDRLVRVLGFRMGPFELMDLIGLDVNLAVSESVYRAFFEEPRFRPHPLQRRMVQAGLLGRKSGKGWYDYGDRPSEPGPGSAPATPRAFNPWEAAMGTQPLKARILIVGAPAFAEDLGGLFLEHGHPTAVLTCEGEIPATLRPDLEAEARSAGLAVEALPFPIAAKRTLIAMLDEVLPPETPLLSLCLTASATQVAGWTRHPERVVGFTALPPLTHGTPVELAAPLSGDAHLLEAIRDRLEAIGLRPEIVRDAVGMVLPRILCMLINEAAFAVMEGVATPEDIDTAMKLGTNYPRGPLEWGDLLGLDLVVAVLDALEEEHRSGAYRAAPLLRQMVRAGRLGRKSGRGFYEWR